MARAQVPIRMWTLAMKRRESKSIAEIGREDNKRTQIEGVRRQNDETHFQGIQHIHINTLRGAAMSR